MRVAIVGAGMAGLACAHRLLGAGADVRVFDKSRGPGGRLATKRLDPGQADIGAQYFTVRDPLFAEHAAAWRRSGVIAPWTPRLVRLAPGRSAPLGRQPERWVGVPRMSALTRHLAEGLELTTAATVQALHRSGDGWYLGIREHPVQGPYDRVVIALPAPQAALLLRADAPALAERADACRMAGCWSAALHVDADDAGFDAAFVDDGTLGWLARDGSKPGRPDSRIWVAHASPGWSGRNLERDPAGILRDMTDRFRAVIGTDVGVEGLLAHRWRHARATRGNADGEFLLDRGLGLGACGDWCRDSRVEGAWLSGHALGSALAGHG